MTTPPKTEIRDRNSSALSKIRASEPKPYEEKTYVLRALTIPGRSSGHPRTVPIAVVQFDGTHYICAPDRGRDWVQNLIAAEHCDLEGDPEPRHQADLVDDEAAAGAVYAYLAKLGKPSTMWPFPSDASPEEIHRHLGNIAVFRLKPRTP
ncbi:nitroreductase family deazaflavin-dependent oxidoreductase [Amycolatopsis umgeniensis]|uniref:Deazaflavin-dependent oxidoreductase, nitroreductase family n=1 Tax=Amycolatopsis umgeniensis TaxID=336628 RepID=A0A841BCU6_9PSEU|nr:nitroreductase family deazaflavin-dependent oxidoreductase [Amycolatopsis umgeniensis]MBB5856392.1 hypothetical protein [Amycolatopsis umgeniensis]